MSDAKTYDEQMARAFAFGTDEDPRLRRLRELYAEIIGILDEGRGAVPPTMAGHEAGRQFSVAITHAQTAQMWAVKATSFKV